MADYVGENIRRYRKQRGLTLKALAIRASVPQSTLSEVETGRRQGANLTLETGKRIAVALGVRVDHLLGLTKAGDGEDDEEDAA